MEPIISPWIVYIIGIIDNLQTLLVAVIIILGFATVVYVGISTDSGRAPNKRLVGTMVVGAFLMMLLSVMIPNKKIMIAMVVANEITYDRAEMVGGAISDFKNEIVKLIDENEGE